MKRLCLFALTSMFVLFGCTTQPLGARCEQDQDCSEAVSGIYPVVCRRENAQGTACGAGESCVCVSREAASDASTTPPVDASTADR
jgi:hypothetical protein